MFGNTRQWLCSDMLQVKIVVFMDTLPFSVVDSTIVLQECGASSKVCSV